MGKPVTYTPITLENKFNAYIDKCVLDGKFANITGFCLFANINDDTYYEYKKKEHYADATKRIEGLLLDVTVQKACEAKNPAFLIFYMKNKFKWTDRQEVVSENINHNLNSDVQNKTIDELKAELQDLEKK